MKRLTVLIILFFLPVMAFGEKNTSLGKITYISGQGHIKAKDQKEWKELKTEMVIHDLDNIKTAGQSRCEISFQKKKVIRIGENSDIKVTKDMAGVEKVKVAKGELWLSVHLPEMESAITVETPSTACSIRGTVYRLTCDDNYTTYRCYQGELEIEPTVNKDNTQTKNNYLVNRDEELIIVINFEEYKQKEENAFMEYLKKTKGDFETYKKDQKQAFREMIEKEWADFKKTNGFYFKHHKFDQSKDMALDWVKWNMERDKEMIKESVMPSALPAPPPIPQPLKH